MTSTIVTRLLLDNSKVDVKATGVELGQTRDGPRFVAKARKEVILCLGAFNTPQLLLASGIGPAKDLEELGVDVKVDIEGVGKGLRDHPMAGICYKAKPGKSNQYLTDNLKSVGS